VKNWSTFLAIREMQIKATFSPKSEWLSLRKQAKQMVGLKGKKYLNALLVSM
jgi:hypothetical protein